MVLVAAAGQHADAQDVLAGRNMFGGTNFGTVGASQLGFGPLGSGGLGIGTPGSIATGKGNRATVKLSVGGGETDNVFLQSGGPKHSQTLAVAGLNVALSRDEPRLGAAATGNFEDLYYVQNAFGNKLIGSFSGQANVGLVPNRFNWVVDEAYGQNLVSPLEPPVPSNLQNVNVISTGPDLLLHPGGLSNFLQLGLRYARSDYQTLPFGAYEGVGLLAVGHDLSQRSEVSLHVAEQKMRFNNSAVNQDYTLRKAYGSYAIQGARTAIEIEAGAAQVNDRIFRSRTWTTRPIAQLLLTRRLSPTMTLSLKGGRQVTDISDSFANLQSGAAGAIVLAPTYGTTSSYLSTYGSASWTFALDRTSVNATGGWERSSYDLSPLLDTTIQNYTFQIERRVTRRFVVSVTGTFVKTDYYTARFENNTGVGNLALQWQLAPNLQAALQYQYTSQGNSRVFETLARSGYFNLINRTSANLTDTYSANSVFFMFTYVPFAE